MGEILLINPSPDFGLVLTWHYFLSRLLSSFKDESQWPQGKRQACYCEQNLTITIRKPVPCYSRLG